MFVPNRPVVDNLEAASQADLILVGVKPFQVPDVITEIKPALTPSKTIVSFAASVKTRAIEEAAGMEIAVIRAILMNHIIHHRGQLTVYLRQLDVALPSVYGPTADDNPFM